MNDWTPFNFETVTVASATVAVALTSSLFLGRSGGNVKFALVTVDPGVPIRYTLNGTTVTTGTGHALTAYGKVELYGEEMIRGFRTTSTQSGTAGSISVTYFR